MDSMPTKRNWPSFSSIMRLKVSRHACGATSGSTPSSTSIKPKAVINVVVKPIPYCYLRPVESRMYLKKSELGSNTSTSLF